VRIRYEGVALRVDPADWMHRIFIRRAVKRRIGRFIGRPYRTDDYLSLAYRTLEAIENPVIVDVGCNIGATALPIAARFPAGKIIAIDAHPVPLARMIANVRLNALANVRVIAAAISDQCEPARIYTCATNSGGSRLSGFEGRTDVGEAMVCDDITVPAITLRQAMSAQNIDQCDLLKIDTEGFEVHVLKSLGNWLSPQRVRAVVCEYGPEGLRSAGSTGWEMVSLMQFAGYSCRDLHSQKSICEKADIPNLADFTTTDFLFTATA
jgi:FkbM family methyltransferase